MPIPNRILRAAIDDLPGRRPEPSARETDRADRIVEAARLLICTHGRDSLTLRSIAAAMRLTHAMVQRHFADMESLIGEILTRHLQALAAVLNRIPAGAPAEHAARRAAYIAATRTGFGAFTPLHDLFVRHRGALPPDLADPLDQFRHSLGILLAGDQADAALSLLDTPSLDPAKIEALLDRLARPEAPVPAVPARPPARLAAVTQPTIEDTLVRAPEARLREESKANIPAWRRKPPSRRQQALCSTTQARAGP